MSREQEAADDAVLDKRVRDIATGKERQKRRRGGLDFDDSDDEDADKEERDRMRRERILRKKRKVDDDSLDELGKSLLQLQIESNGHLRWRLVCIGKQEATVPFVSAYYEHIEDTETVIEPLPEDDEEMADVDADEDEDGDGDEDRPRVVAMSDLHKQLREVARSGKDKVRLSS